MTAYKFTLSCYSNTYETVAIEKTKQNRKQTEEMRIECGCTTLQHNNRENREQRCKSFASN